VSETDGGSIQSDRRHITPCGKTVFDDPRPFESFTIAGKPPAYHNVCWKDSVESADELTPIDSQTVREDQYSS
jgi:hypothetical protein